MNTEVEKSGRDGSDGMDIQRLRFRYMIPTWFVRPFQNFEPLKLRGGMVCPQQGEVAKRIRSLFVDIQVKCRVCDLYIRKEIKPKDRITQQEDADQPDQLSINAIQDLVVNLGSRPLDQPAQDTKQQSGQQPVRQEEEQCRNPDIDPVIGRESQN